jgi:hypothetical protein
VQSVQLDDQLANLPKINFVKIDVEGHEPKVLEGFSRLIVRHRPVLLVEFNPRCLIEPQKQDPLAFLKQVFNVYRQVRVISGFQDDVIFENADKLLKYWEKRNRDMVAQKLLPDGMLCFDLIGIP